MCLEAQRFDLALVDMRLDETDEANAQGLDLAEEIRRRWPTIRIIIITDYGTLESVRRAMKPDEQGQTLADVVISKTECEYLIQAVSRVLFVCSQHRGAWLVRVFAPCYFPNRTCQSVQHTAKHSSLLEDKVVTVSRVRSSQGSTYRPASCWSAPNFMVWWAS